MAIWNSPSLWALPEELNVPKRIDQFWSHVRLGEGCWTWTGERRAAGDRTYGQFVIEACGHRVRFRAHRFALESVAGPIPSGLIVRHACDNRLCVNPDHLTAGTHLQNARDALHRGRFRAGRFGTPKLTADQVRELRARLARGEGPTDVARRFGLSRDRVKEIQRGKAYAWVPAEVAGSPPAADGQ